jgi:hypothetical protein
LRARGYGRWCVVAIAALFSFTLLVATIAWAGWFLFGGKSVRKKARKWLLRVLCWFPPRTRDGAINKVLVEFGYTQAGLTRYSGSVVLIFLFGIVIVTLLAFLFGSAIPLLGPVPKVGGKFLVTPIVAGLIGVSTLFFGLHQWQKARSEISLDKFYERLAETNDKRVKWWTAPRQHGRLEPFARSLVRETSWDDGRLFGRSQKEDSRGRGEAPHEPERGRSRFSGLASPRSSVT